MIDEIVRKREAHERMLIAGRPASTVAFLRASVFNSEKGPAAEFLLIPFGDVEVDRALAGRSFEFTRAHADAAASWFEALGRKLAIDYEHQSFDRFNTRPDGLKPAAGWIGGLAVREDGLWATEVTWTARAREMLTSGEYRYFSPVIYWSDDDYSILAGLGPVGLTNDPAMRGVAALAGGRELRGKEESGIHDQGSAEEGGGLACAHGAPREDAMEDREEAVLCERLHDAEQQIAVLRQALRAQAADEFVERGMRLGKIVESTCGDWREDFLRDEKAAEMRLSRAPVLLPPGRVLKLDAHSGATSAAAGEGAGDESSQDMAAYEVARRAGRVLMNG